MKFVEEADGSFSAAQLAAAERELEQQKKEWELDRLRALREEEERRLRLADDDEKPLTFGREDSQNQVNNSSNNKRVGVKKRPEANRGRIVENSRIAVNTKRRGSLRRCTEKRGNRLREQSITESEEEDDTTTDSEDTEESQDDDLVEDSPDEESSHTESQSQGDEEEAEEEEEAEDEDEDEVENDEKNQEDKEADEDEEFRDTRNTIDRGGARGNGNHSKRRDRLNKSSERNNRWDINSPRTRSRGDVKINLWTLDVSPILPGAKPTFRSNRKLQGRGRKKSEPSKSEDGFVLPMSPASPKKNINPSSGNPLEKATSILEEKSTEDEDDDETSWTNRGKNSANENANKQSETENNQMTSSPIVTVAKMANVEILIAEKMSEISCNMEMSQSDESAEHERSCAFSSDSRSNGEDDIFDVSSPVTPLKRPSLDSPRVQIAPTDLHATRQETTEETLNQTDVSRPSRTRAKIPGVKRLTQTFDASFDESGVNSNFESESLISGTTSKTAVLQVRRSTHKSCASFGKSLTDEETPNNSEIVPNRKLSSAEKSHEDRNKIEESLRGTENEAATIENSNSPTTKRSTIPLTRASRRSNAKSVTPDRDKATLNSPGGECIAPTSLKHRNVAKRTQSKMPLEDVPKAIESLCPESVKNSTETSNDENGSQNPEFNAEKQETTDRDVKSNPPKICSAEKVDNTCDEKKEKSAETDRFLMSQIDKKIILSSFAFANPSIALCNKLNAEPRVRLRRPDTPLPGIVTRRTKPTSGPEASTSGVSNDVDTKSSPLQTRKSLEGRRSTRLSSGLPVESQDLELAMQNMIKCEAKVVLIKRPETSSGEQLKLKKASNSSSSTINISSLTSSQITANSPKIIVKKLDNRITRSSLSSGTENSKTNSSLSANDRPTTRSSRPSLDNGFLVPQSLPRKIKSVGGGGTSENLSQPSVRLNRKSATNETIQQATSVSSFPVSQKRRPDTPLPSIESPTRVTRSRAENSSQNSILLKSKNSRRTSNESVARLRRSGSPPGSPVKRGDANDTDSNGNAVVHENSSKTTSDQDSSSSIFEHEKPQRTAKVVAILTLESRSNNHKGASPNSPVKKSIDDNDSKSPSISSNPSSSVDVDSESESSDTIANDSTLTRKLSARKSIKRTRMSIGKSLTTDDSDVQLLDVVDENKDEDSPVQPTRKLVKLHSSATSIDKLNSTAS